MSLRIVIAGFILRITGNVWASYRGFHIASFACGYGLGCNLKASVACKLLFGFKVITGFAYKLHLSVKVRAFEVRSYRWVSTSGPLAHTATTGFQLQSRFRKQLPLGFNFRAGFANSYHWVSTSEQVSHTATNWFQHQSR